MFFKNHSFSIEIYFHITQEFSKLSVHIYLEESQCSSLQYTSMYDGCIILCSLQYSRFTADS